MEPLDVAKKMNLKIIELEKLNASLEPLSLEKAKTAAEYDKQIAMTAIGLKNGKTYELEGNVIQNPPVTIIEKLSKGVCWLFRLHMDTADYKYKNTFENIDTTKAQLNAYQSINRFLSEV